MKTKLLLFVSIFGTSLITYSQENELPDSGNVGIGTTEPTAKLDVRGTAKIDSSLIVNDSIVIANSAKVGDDLKVLGDAYFDNNAYVNNNLKVAGRAVLNTGEVNGDFFLQGLNDPSSLDGFQLVLRDPLTGQLVKSSMSSLGTILYSLQCISQNGVVDNPTWLNGPNKLFVGCPEVNVGIGTTDPQFKLDVRGKGYFEKGVQAGNVQNNTFTTTALYEGMKIESISGPLMRLAVKKTNGTIETRFKVESDGLVYCTEVRVRPTTAIPDYVFKPNYDLMTFEELRTFVNTENHLPNVPSEQEIIEQGGTNVNEMQMKLLEKVEELTLYILQLDQKNAELEKKIQELELLQTKQQ